MDKGVALGPLLFPTPVLVLAAALIVALAVAGALHRRGKADAQTALWSSLALALLAARMAFILRRWPQYQATPWSMLNIRDGGFMAWPGIVVLVLSVALVFWRRSRLRLPLAAASLSGLSVWLLATLAVTQLSAASQRPLPDLTLHDLKGATQPLRHAGTPMVVNLWATWCPPCRREMPMLVQAEARMPGVHFVFVDQAESPATVHAYLRTLPRMPRHVLIDDGQHLARHFTLRGTPTTLFVDARGIVRDIHVGELSAATLADGLSYVTPSAPARSGVSP